MSVQNIYFDESGFTGGNLLSKDQELFAYGSVACSDNEAKEVVSEIIKKYKIQSSELKGSPLIGSVNGRRAVLEILRIFEGRYKGVVFDKKYALACKFFEYIFEPVIASKSTIFYNIDFHKYIANILYLDFMNKSDSAITIFEKFHRSMKAGHLDEMKALFKDDFKEGIFPPIEQILEFAHAHEIIIGDEIAELPAWILDLSTTAVYSLLCEWGKTGQQMRAICDNSKPLAYDRELFDCMIDRKDQQKFQRGSETQVITFNLSEPIIMGDSKEHYGIQIADVVAAACVYASNPVNTDEFAATLREILPSSISNSMFPDIDYVDLDKPQARLNTMILMELHRRSIEKTSILEKIEYTIYFAQKLIGNSKALIL
jgi:hypothetical protein